MHTRLLDSLAAVPAAQWNALVPDRQPFLCHEFLLALERNDCVGSRTGWLPRHIVCCDARQQLLGATPLYLKDNSYGEFVFDWNWADAYRRLGLAYYPKLVSAVPFTPATGPRLLLAPAAEALRREAAGALIERAVEEARRHAYSSIHWLFTTDADMQALLGRGLLRRLGYQFHWQNQGYRDFADFLATLTSKKRKNINRERRRVAEAGIELQVLHGHEVSEAQWHAFHTFYCDTFHRLGGVPTLTLAFFQEIAATLGGQIILVLAWDGRRTVAGALSLRSEHTLYGRHWGCRAAYDSLHFETCYYQGIEYCIRHHLQRFEPGAQGEHKIFRGFLPVPTQSAHWIGHPGLRRAVADFLERETAAVNDYASALAQHSPYREAL